MQLVSRNNINSSVSNPQGLGYQLVSEVVKGRQKQQNGLGEIVKTLKLSEKFLSCVCLENKNMQNRSLIPHFTH